MKRILTFVSALVLVALTASALLGASSDAAYEQNSQKIRCPECNGEGQIKWVTPWGTTELITCSYCKSFGWTWATVTMEGNRKVYYAECSRHRDGCRCKLFNPEKSGSSKCRCGHPKSAHVKRYL